MPRRSHPWPRCRDRIRRVVFGERAAAVREDDVTIVGGPIGGSMESLIPVDLLLEPPPAPVPPRPALTLDLRSAPSMMEQRAAAWAGGASA